MSERNCGLDFLKFICAFLVVCIHIPFPNQLGAVTMPILRIAVPIFFMITGFYYSHTVSTGRVKIQIFKIFKLFIFVNLAFVPFNFVCDLIFKGHLNDFVKNIFSLEALRNFLIFNVSPIAGHLWYLGAVIYVLVIIAIFEKKWERTKLYPLIPILLLLDLAFGKYSVLIFGRTFDYFLVRNFLFVGLPYFLLGDLLFRYKHKFKSAYLIMLSAIFSVTSFTEYIILEINNLSGGRDHYISTTFLAVTFFLLFSNYKEKSNSGIYNKICFLGSKLTLWIYIIHPMLIRIFKGILGFLSPKPDLFIGILSYSAPIVIFAFSVLFSYLIYLFRCKSQKLN